MRRVSAEGVARALKTFRKEKVLTLVAVADLIHSSVHTARRLLKTWKVFHSYNQNGIYYTLPNVPEFDANGLWRHRGVFFSKYGTLKQTVIELICRSGAGLDAAEVGAIVGLDPRSFFSAFAKHAKLRREKTQGRFVYYAAEPSMGARQRQQRGAMNASAKQPSELEAIAILVEQIKHPASNFDDLSKQLKKLKFSIAPQTIQNFFTRSGLTVKKTPHLI